MKNIKLKFGFYLAITVFLTFGLSLSLQSLLAAWQAPSDLPPLSNINPPIFDVSTDTTFHVTSKPLGVTGNLTVNGNQFITGNVGIGTSSPTAKLEVSSGTHTTRFSGNSILFSRSDGPAYIYANSVGGYLAFGTNGRSTSVINSNLVLSTDQSSYFTGSVGVGKVPATSLDVNGVTSLNGTKTCQVIGFKNTDANLFWGSQTCPTGWNKLETGGYSNTWYYPSGTETSPSDSHIVFCCPP